MSNFEYGWLKGVAARRDKTTGDVFTFNRQAGQSDDSQAWHVVSRRNKDAFEPWRADQ